MSEFDFSMEADNDGTGAPPAAEPAALPQVVPQDDVALPETPAGTDGEGKANEDNVIDPKTTTLDSHINSMLAEEEAPALPAPEAPAPAAAPADAPAEVPAPMPAPAPAEAPAVVPPAGEPDGDEGVPAAPMSGQR